MKLIFQLELKKQYYIQLNNYKILFINLQKNISISIIQILYIKNNYFLKIIIKNNKNILQQIKYNFNIFIVVLSSIFSYFGSILSLSFQFVKIKFSGSTYYSVFSLPGKKSC
ncbi:hypothetical protein PPERSA_05540 [Pseudocohnilembus persalinus]|uniref:Transmembrane protein n=1 Tax=Pseudocohnilembus persalinus TaxID=266149 RepID=A0A0V0QT80_PSEPJ|nr:hypothetical protein PPERSA_05540 [Pseudocohnilembus persalinus]|eukprot:KRX05431.1 hypothetical protein PPERSA_05540 [Pseudocohnilembus persalinus]